MLHLSRYRFACALSFIVGIGTSLLGSDKPNILWITSEDHGPEMGCYGDKLARTPNIDALAKKGMIFNRAWSCAPVCAPARTAIISGIYPSSSGGIHMRSMVPMPSGTKMYPQFLREAGYFCTNNSKEDYNLVQPKKLWNDSSGKAHWRARGDNQPFFAVFNSTKSHESQIRVRPHTAITNPADVRVPHYHPDLPEVREDWAQYYDIVSEADADAGKLLKQLDDDHLSDETIVFYYGDHGSGMPRSKRWPANSGLHVPMVVYFPPKWQHLAPKEYQVGGKSDRLVNFIDLAPTVLSLAGVKPPAQMQGHAFAGQYQQVPTKFLFGERGRMDERYDLVRSVTDGRHVYLRNYYPNVSQAQHVDYQFQTPTTRVWKDLFDRGQTNAEQSKFWEIPKAPEELYDLLEDRDGAKNVAGQERYKVVLATLREANRNKILQVRDVCFLPEGEMHSRSQEISPYDLARNESKYPLERILEAAELASNFSTSATSQLLKNLTDDESVVRYWGALGFLIRGNETFDVAKPALLAALNDRSPYVQIVAAQALITFGSVEDRKPALDVLGKLAPPDKNNVFVSMASLNAIETLAKKAESLHEIIRTMNANGDSPDGRFDAYVPRLIQNIVGESGSSKKEKPRKQDKTPKAPTS